MVAAVIVVEMSTTPLIVLAMVVMTLLSAGFQRLAETLFEESSETIFDIALVFSLAPLLVLGLVVGWVLVVGFRALRCVFDTSPGRTLLLLLVYIVVGFVPDIYLMAAG